MSQSIEKDEKTPRSPPLVHLRHSDIFYSWVLHFLREAGSEQSVATLRDATSHIKSITTRAVATTLSFSLTRPWKESVRQ
mmetsp:Transcript_18511/g.42213  ORF Transcript_18511/g.42213 Transcript_18511/m.42213 type:complete len:80 (-) Transcript_18511:667-906(-)|eukprot:760667-Hanusia_phi.AAC.3